MPKNNEEINIAFVASHLLFNCSNIIPLHIISSKIGAIKHNELNCNNRGSLSISIKAFLTQSASGIFCSNIPKVLSYTKIYAIVAMITKIPSFNVGLYLILNLKFSCDLNLLYIFL